MKKHRSTKIPAPRRLSTRGRAAPPVLLVALCLLLGLLVGALPADAYEKKIRERIAELPEVHQEFLAMVEALITEEELETFLELPKDYQRDAFIERFWRVRDAYDATGRNEFRERFEARVEEAKIQFGSLGTEPAKLFLLNGAPQIRLEINPLPMHPDAVSCPILQPMEIWYYRASEQVGHEFFLIFYRPSRNLDWRLWRPTDGIRDLVSTNSVASPVSPGSLGFGNQGAGRILSEVRERCRNGDFITAAIGSAIVEGVSYDQVLYRAGETPDVPAKEWVATFNAYSTELPAGAATLPAELSFEFPGRRQGRTVVQSLVTVPRKEVGEAALAGHRSYNFLVTGEVLAGGSLFDNFRYKFDLPTPEVTGERIPLVFERYLRPGEYRLILKLEDLNSGRFHRTEREIEVPAVDEAMPPPPPSDPESARLLAEANAALAAGETTIQIVEPLGQIFTGLVRYDTLATGDAIDRVTFALDGEPVLTKKRPPYSVELDLGSLPRTRELTVTAFDEEGFELASDSLLVNSGGSRFSVDLVEPKKGRTYEGSVRAEARVETPEQQPVERVEFYLNETLVATLYQEPWVQPIVLPEDEYLAYVRTVAYLPDGNATEDLVFVNAPDYQEEIDVQFVELYAAVLDRSGRPVEGLPREAFRPIENGVEQTIARFEVVDDLPLHTGVLLDVSASMEEGLGEARDAALSFFEQTVKPKDRAALMTFNDYPELAVQFTNEVDELAGGLAGLKAERGTALYDSIIFALYYFNGVRGQRALLVFSDGKDEASRFSFDDTLDYARRAGVTVYSVALRDDDAHKKLSKIAQETGGRAFFVEDPGELAAVYDQIQQELRSRYLIAYQSSITTEDDEFRTVELEVDRPGVEAKTIQGYYP